MQPTTTISKGTGASHRVASAQRIPVAWWALGILWEPEASQTFTSKQKTSVVMTARVAQLQAATVQAVAPRPAALNREAKRKAAAQNRLEVDGDETSCYQAFSTILTTQILLLSD